MFMICTVVTVLVQVLSWTVSANAVFQAYKFSSEKSYSEINFLTLGAASLLVFGIIIVN